MYALSLAAKRLSSAGVGSRCFSGLGGSIFTLALGEFLELSGGRGGGGVGIAVEEPEPDGADCRSGLGSSAGIFSS
jgi:hypothetical protein